MCRLCFTEAPVSGLPGTKKDFYAARSTQRSLWQLVDLLLAGNESKITELRAQQLIASLEDTNTTALVQIISASECPRISYDHLRRSFNVLDATPSCFAKAQVRFLIMLS